MCCCFDSRQAFYQKAVRHEKAIRKALHKFPLTAEAVINRQNMYNEQRKFVFDQEKLGNVLRARCPVLRFEMAHS